MTNQDINCVINENMKFNQKDASEMFADEFVRIRQTPKEYLILKIADDIRQKHFKSDEIEMINNAMQKRINQIAKGDGA